LPRAGGGAAQKNRLPAVQNLHAAPRKGPAHRLDDLFKFSFLHIASLPPTAFPETPAAARPGTAAGQSPATAPPPRAWAPPHASRCPPAPPWPGHSPSAAAPAASRSSPPPSGAAWPAAPRPAGTGIGGRHTGPPCCTRAAAP